MRTHRIGRLVVVLSARLQCELVTIMPIVPKIPIALKNKEAQVATGESGNWPFHTGNNTESPIVFISIRIEPGTFSGQRRA